ncbi:Membrane-bound lytic murein transglycosylase F precursor [Vibrio aerogenes CECT 7868]|uniref:Membrane-bound lytic murein transglycosylase F n=1 Tax=Vibrio aerogenes CECT 7868 TaxID=1216006 RepID=A0A1M5Z2P2_9VIBR|nr:Membrane-bound lytic murein transglycosylase F precursor [Vibrio aerogenes CECT 7868]
MTRFFRHTTQLLILWFSCVALLSGCQIDSKPKSELDQIKQRGVLRVGTVNNGLSYFIGPDGPSGLDYELVREFASELGVKLEVKPVYRISSLFPALKRGEIDIIAAGQSQTKERISQFRPGPVYYYVSQQVVYRQGQWKPRNIKQIIRKQNDPQSSEPQKYLLSVVEDSHFEQTLIHLKNKYPDLRYQVETNSDIHDLLKQVSEGSLAFTIADSIEISLAQRIYPELATAFEITDDQPVSWFIRRSDDESLYALMIEFFGQQKQAGLISSLEEKYIGHVGTFDYVDTRAFLRAIDDRLPKWSPLFKQYAEEFDWRLVAALAYQESHWNPKAKSPTGVRGMMMLTLPTAKAVGIKNRLNAEQSIKGGVKYLRKLVSRIPDSIPAHEKIWFALASYNMGFGHVMDARRLTRSQGGDPDAWGDVKDRLPLLRKRKYFSQTRYGYARGNEALTYVENIRRYYQSLIGHLDSNGVTAHENGTETEMDDLVVIPGSPVQARPVDEQQVDDGVKKETIVEQASPETTHSDTEKTISDTSATTQKISAEARADSAPSNQQAPQITEKKQPESETPESLPVKP